MGRMTMGRILTVALVAAVALAGCDKKSEPGGRGGDDTFRIVVPAGTSEVKQGEVQTVGVKVERGEGFKQGIKLEVKAPAGLKVDPESTLVKPGDKGEVQLKITAADNAPLGEQKIQVHGTPDKGDATQTEFKIVVRDGNATFRIALPLAISRDVKQGEVLLVRVSVERGEGFKQGIKLEVKAPTGLKVDPESTLVKPGDKGEVQLKITAADNAPLGEQKIMVKGTPDKGDSAETEFKVTVSVK